MADKYIHHDDNHEDHHENKNPNWPWPFASEEEEHRHFDNLQRARDIRSSR